MALDRRIDFDSVAWESPMKGVRFKAYEHDGRRLRLVEYTKAMEPHWCEKGHIGMVLEGSIEIRFQDQRDIYQAGNGIWIPSGPDHKHMAAALTDVVRVVFVEDLQPACRMVREEA